MDEFLKFAIHLAQEVGGIMKENFTLGMKKEWKEDGTPLTATDTKINQIVLNAIQKRYPDHSIISEEGSKLLPQREYTWVCDPLDGTVAFSHGYPIFTFSIALLRYGESILGVIYDPISNRLASAVKGEGAFLNDKKISVSSEKYISKKSIINVHSDLWARVPDLRYNLIKKSGCYATVFYSTAYVSLLVAFGEFLAEICESPYPWDGAAAKIIVEEAGGKVTDLLGKEQSYDQKINGYIASNGFVHKELVDIITSILKK